MNVRIAPSVPPAGAEAAALSGTPSSRPAAPSTGPRPRTSLAGPGVPSASVPHAAAFAQAARVCSQAHDAVVALFDAAQAGSSLPVTLAEQTVDRMMGALDDDAEALVSLVRVKSHHDYAHMHSVAVCALMAWLGRHLGLSRAAQREAAMAGLLHDIGKAFIPAEVLSKPGRLTDGEFQLVKAHPARGYEALKAEARWDESIIDVAHHHHERPDGRGYPDRLEGEGISLLSRMGAVCDVYDAITSNRPYKNGWDPMPALQHLAEWSRHGQFDGAIVEAFAALMGPLPVGSLVRLRSQRLAVVNAGRPTAVTAFYCLRQRCRVAPQLVQLGRDDEVEAMESNEQWRFEDLDALWAGPFARQIQQVHRRPPIRGT
jgi:HD-GYP domain-containing protein (c-di-GMP phosphodiesterase class II)